MATLPLEKKMESVQPPKGTATDHYDHIRAAGVSVCASGVVSRAADEPGSVVQKALRWCHATSASGACVNLLHQSCYHATGIIPAADHISPRRSLTMSH